MKLKKLFLENDNSGAEQYSASLDLTTKEVELILAFIEYPKTPDADKDLMQRYNQIEHRFSKQLQRLSLLMSNVDNISTGVDLTEPLDLLDLTEQASDLILPYGLGDPLFISDEDLSDPQKIEAALDGSTENALQDEDVSEFIKNRVLTYEY